MSESGWITQREAARLLGVHPSLIPKMLRRSDLTSRGLRPSLSRADVLELAAARTAAAAEREDRRTAPPRSTQPPDGQYEWLRAPAAAAVLGCTTIALQGRCARGQVPYTVHDGRRWFRLDLLELQVRARVAEERRRVGSRR